MTDPQDLSNDERESARIQLPFEVELGHPSIGKIRSVARDISESGIFVRLNPSGLRPGAKIKVTVLNAALVESNPTPTIEMEVARVTEEGLGLKFTNRTSQHLWNSVDRLRQDLRLGQDYFQVFQGAAIVNQLGKLLVVQRHGKWLFPGEYLTVGSAWQDTVTDYLTAELGIDDLVFEDTLGIDSAPGTAGRRERDVQRVSPVFVAVGSRPAAGRLALSPREMGQPRVQHRRADVLTPAAARSRGARARSRRRRPHDGQRGPIQAGLSRDRGAFRRMRPRRPDHPAPQPIVDVAIEHLFPRYVAHRFAHRRHDLRVARLLDGAAVQRARDERIDRRVSTIACGGRTSRKC